MAKLIVAIDIDDSSWPIKLRQSIENDKNTTDGWFTKNQKLAIDNTFLKICEDDDSFYEFELIDIKD